MSVSELQTIEHAVLVVGAGGAGIRAAIESASQGLSTGLLSKSLLGKAHTVMAEGGVAAALGNVDSRDNWKIHFRDTMRGGKFLNQWRMAPHPHRHCRPLPGRCRRRRPPETQTLSCASSFHPHLRRRCPLPEQTPGRSRCQSPLKTEPPPSPASWRRGRLQAIPV